MGELKAPRGEKREMVIAGINGASDFLVDGEVENWRPDNSPFGFYVM